MRHDEDDEALVARTLAGELGAFELLVARHQAVVHRVAARVVGPEAAQDVTQDAFLRAFHRLGSFRSDAPFRAWLLRIAFNTAITAAARRDPQPLADPATDAPRAQPLAPALTADRPLPADALERGERSERLASKLATLRPAHRAVLVLRDVEGLSYEQIADVTGMPLGSVKGRLHRARDELAALLRANTYDWELPA